jgi:sugar lactone lactonase YvrE
MMISDRVRLQLFDGTGKRIRITGRRGRGPGEFANIVGMCRMTGDTVLVADSANGRVAVIDRKGRLVRTIPVNGRVPLLTNRCFDDGSVLVSAAQEGVRTLARGTAFYVGNPGTSEVRRFDSTGKLQLIVRSDDRPQRFNRVAVDAAGRIWIQDFQKFNAIAPDGWTAFDANGAMLGRLVISVPSHPVAQMTVLSFGRDEVFVRRIDAQGALHLTVYPLIKRGPGASSAPESEVTALQA